MTHDIRHPDESDAAALMEAVASGIAISATGVSQSYRERIIRGPVARLKHSIALRLSRAALPTRRNRSHGLHRLISPEALESLLFGGDMI